MSTWVGRRGEILHLGAKEVEEHRCSSGSKLAIIHYGDDGGLSSGSDNLDDKLEFLDVLDTLPPLSAFPRTSA